MNPNRYPGFLYAKRVNDASEAREYKVLFCHAAFHPHEKELSRLRESFEWGTGRKAFEPVLAVRPLSNGTLLLVRFLDDGKDSFGRDHTLRMEAFLVPLDDLAKLWNGMFSVKAVPNEAMFEVMPFVPDRSSGNGTWWLHEQLGTFRFDSASSCFSTDIPSAPTAQTSPTKPFSPHSGNRMPPSSPPRRPKKMLLFFLMAWVVTLLVAVFLYLQNRDLVERSENEKRKADENERNMESRERSLVRRESRMDRIESNVRKIREISDGILLDCESNGSFDSVSTGDVQISFEEGFNNHEPPNDVLSESFSNAPPLSVSVRDDIPPLPL